MDVLIGIPYLEAKDVKQGGVQPYVTNGKPVVMMIQGNFCHFCKEAKPAFQKFADSTPGVTCVTIQTDGKGKEASQFFPTNGVPAFFGFDKSGKLVGKHEGGRDVDSLRQFARTL